MIDFKYHVVSIIAVFLALAVGIVVGTTALNGQLLDDLQGRVGGLAGDNQELRAEVNELRDEVGDNQSFADALEPSIVEGRLEGDNVVLVTAPLASGEVGDRLAERIEEAGATVTGRVRLTEAYTDPANSALLDDLVTRLLPAGVELPTGGDVGVDERAATELASVLVRSDQSGTGEVSADSVTRVLAGFREAGLLELDGKVVPGDMALVSAGSPPQDAKPDTAEQQRLERVLTLVRALDERTGATVLVGPPDSADSGGLVQMLRDDADLREQVSAVDGADSAVGRIAAVLALDAESRGQSGQYGRGPGSSASVPSPEPAAAAG